MMRFLNKYYYADVIEITDAGGVIVGGTVLEAPFWMSPLKAFDTMNDGVKMECGSEYKTINFRRIK
ncbi:MAG: hypothetical protein ACRCVE_01900 [Plesiomonas sp.]